MKHALSKGNNVACAAPEAPQKAFIFIATKKDKVYLPHEDRADDLLKITLAEIWCQQLCN